MMSELVPDTELAADSDILCRHDSSAPKTDDRIPTTKRPCI